MRPTEIIFEAAEGRYDARALRYRIVTQGEHWNVTTATACRRATGVASGRGVWAGLAPGAR